MTSRVARGPGAVARRTPAVSSHLLRQHDQRDDVQHLQRSVGNRATAHMFLPTVQRDPRAGRTIRRDDRTDAPSKAQTTNLYYVIGDKRLNVGGGVFLTDLEALKTELLKTTLEGGEWTLTLTMHGAETFFALSAGDVTGGITEKDPGAYNKSKIQQIFGDKQFQAWRQKHGPKRINLLSCQIGPELENAFLSLLRHPSSTQTAAIGLGAGCILYNTPLAVTIDKVHVKTRQQFAKLRDSEQAIVKKTLAEWNDEYGYNTEKIKSARLLDYYFDVAPEGLWIKVEVRTTSGKFIPYLKRASDKTFIDECSPSRLKKGQREPAVPVPADER